MPAALDHVLRVAVVGALAVAAGAALAAGSWHEIWEGLALELGQPTSAAAVRAQERWQSWGSTCLSALVVAASGLTGLVLAPARHEQVACGDDRRVH